VDDQNRLVGVVQRAAVQEALSESANEDLMKFGGIIGGEELRSMSWNSRAVRRTAFLLPNVLLSAVSVVIILLYEPLIHKLTLLAVFLPLVANLSGAAGNQSVAVSIRELALGLIRPGDWARICAKEAGIGLVNGLFIGLLLGMVAMGLGWASLQLGWIESPQTSVGLAPLALVVAFAYMLNSVVAVVVGGTIPLALKHVGIDPAMASSPILTTVTDMCSFLVTLTLAMGMLYFLVGG
jgi:magnesium transporter